MYPVAQDFQSNPPSDQPMPGYQPYGQPTAHNPNMDTYGMPQQPYPNAPISGGVPPQYMNTGYAKEFFLPNLPWHQPINGFAPPQRVRMVGFCEEKTKRFELNLRKGMDHLLHFNVRFDEKKVIRNSSINGTQWQKEERDGKAFPFKHGSMFTIELIAAGNKIVVMVNGEHFCDFNARDDPRYVSQVEIAGEVRVHSISFGL